MEPHTHKNISVFAKICGQSLHPGHCNTGKDINKQKNDEQLLPSGTDQPQMTEFAVQAPCTTGTCGNHVDVFGML